MRAAIVVIAATMFSGCAIGVPAGKLLSNGVSDYCSHSEPHKLLIMDEVNEAIAPNSIGVVCAIQGVNH